MTMTMTMTMTLTLTLTLTVTVTTTERRTNYYLQVKSRKKNCFKPIMITITITIMIMIMIVIVIVIVMMMMMIQIQVDCCSQTCIGHRQKKSVLPMNINRLESCKLYEKSYDRRFNLCIAIARYRVIAASADFYTQLTECIAKQK